MARDCEGTVVVETKWEVNQRRDPDTGRMDLLITTPESKRIAVDVTVVSPTHADNREGAAAIRAERAKDPLPYGDPERARFVRDAKIDYFGVALETHGEWGQTCSASCKP
jgi:hypothetical protein